MCSLKLRTAFQLIFKGPLFGEVESRIYLLYLGERGTLSVWREGLFLALFVAAAGSILLKDLL